MLALTSYRLVIDASRPAHCAIGNLGELTFPAGRYVYAASAAGVSTRRIARQLCKDKPSCWHIDYLLAAQAFGSSKPFGRGATNVA